MQHRLYVGEMSDVIPERPEAGPAADVEHVRGDVGDKGLEDSRALRETGTDCGFGVHVR